MQKHALEVLFGMGVSASLLLAGSIVLFFWTSGVLPLP